MPLPYKWFSGSHGWITETIKKMPKNTQEALREYFLFKPDDVNELNPAPAPRTNYPGVDRIKGYRYPAPGSQPPAKVPNTESSDRLYDIKYFDRDTRRAEPIGYTIQWTAPTHRLELPPPAEPNTPLSSPGNKNPAVLAYDKTGLRSAMSATHAEMNKSIEQNYPDHLPRPEWTWHIDEIVADAKRQNLPIPIGRRPRYKLPKLARENRI